MLTLHTIDAMRSFRQGKQGLIPFVPTMGALHEGHVSLVRQARALADAGGHKGTVIASIFVNPTQFGPNEDFAKYPRTLESDQAMLKAAGCDAVFVPSAEEMYPGIRRTSTEHSASAISVDPGPLGDMLEGAVRPGHFRGVCTVVAKLLNITQPTHLLLGQKDFQQQLVLRQMCADLNLPTQVNTCPTLREPDGLAMSSRNRYLSEMDRPRAAALSQALELARHGYANGKHLPAGLEHLMRGHLEKAGLEVQYAVVRHQHTLAEFTQGINGPAVGLLAVKLGTTRLIDNQMLN